MLFCGLASSAWLYLDAISQRLLFVHRPLVGVTSGVVNSGNTAITPACYAYLRYWFVRRVIPSTHPVRPDRTFATVGRSRYTDSSTYELVHIEAGGDRSCAKAERTTSPYSRPQPDRLLGVVFARNKSQALVNASLWLLGNSAAGDEPEVDADSALFGHVGIVAV